MKILIFTDVHGNISALEKIEHLARKEKPDLMICAGDISIFGQQLDHILKRIDKLGIKTLMIHGNHEDAGELRVLCGYTKNIEFFHKKARIINNILFIGYGGGGFSITDNVLAKSTKEWKSRFSDKKLRQQKVKARVFFSHAVPYNTKLDRIMQEPCGNRDVRNFILSFKPDYAITGHLHEHAGEKDKLGKTILMNPGPYGKIINI